MRSTRAHSHPIQVRNEIRSDNKGLEAPSSPATQLEIDLSSQTLCPRDEVLFRQALPVLFSLRENQLFISAPNILESLIQNGCIKRYSSSEVGEMRKKAVQLPRREIAEKRERRNLLQLEREYSLWDKIVSIPRLLTSSGIPSGFEEKVNAIKRDKIEAERRYEALSIKLEEATVAKRVLSTLVSSGSDYLAITPLGEQLLRADVLRQLEDEQLTLTLSVHRIHSCIKTFKSLYERYHEIGERLLSRGELKKVWHLGDIQLGLTVSDGSVDSVVDRFTDIYSYLRRDVEGSEKSIALVSLALSYTSEESQGKIGLLKNYSQFFFPDRRWPLPSFFLTQAAQFIHQDVSESSLLTHYENLSNSVSHARWGTKLRLVGQFAAILAANIEGHQELIVNQLTDLSESLEDISGSRSEVEVDVASLLALVEEGSLYRVMQRTSEARLLLGEPPHHSHGSTLVNSVLLAMLPGSLLENISHLKEFSMGGLPTGIFRADCFLLAATYAELEKLDPALLPALGTTVQTSPSVVQAMCQSILSADLMG